MSALAIVKPRDPTEREIQRRLLTGRKYKNPELEKKRQAAITYLRTESRCGWINDRLLPRMK